MIIFGRSHRQSLKKNLKVRTAMPADRPTFSKSGLTLPESANCYPNYALKLRAIAIMLMNFVWGNDTPIYIIIGAPIIIIIKIIYSNIR